MTPSVDVWAAAFAKPSRLWQPVANWQPREWTPLAGALGRIESSGGYFAFPETSLHQDLEAGRIQSVLRLPLNNDGSRQLLRLLQPRFWRHLKIVGIGPSDALVEGEVAGRRLEFAGRLFFVHTAGLDKYYPVAGSAAVRPSTTQPPEPGPRQPPGPKPKGDWKFAVGTELIRLAYVDPAALKNRAKLLTHMRVFLKQEIKWVPKDDKQIAKVIKDYLARIE